MADKTISELTAATSVQNADLFVLEQDSTAKKLTGQVFLSWLVQQADGHGGIQSITWSESGTSGNGMVHTATIHYADQTTSTFAVRDGVKGAKGDTWYTYIKYASRNPSSNADMTNTPSDWIGIYSGTASSAPASYSEYNWYKIRGDVGPGAQLVSSQVMYQESTSASSPTGTWQSTVPAVAQGNYLWTHIILTFDSGNPVDWFEVARQGTNGVDGTGAVSSVNGVGPDANHDVTLTASDINDGSETVSDALASIRNSITSSQPIINQYGVLKGSGSGVVGAATKGVDYGAKTFTVTLTANGWSSNTQTVSSANFLMGDYTYIVGPSVASLSDYAEATVYANDEVTTAGQLVFNCLEAPSNDISVIVMRMVSA